MPDHVITVTEQASERYQEVCDTFYELDRWITNADTVEEVERRTRLQAEMRNTFHQGWGRLTGIGSAHDGPLTITTDHLPLSFTFRYRDSGYTGGLIFHPLTSEEATVGTFSIHT